MSVKLSVVTRCKNRLDDLKITLRPNLSLMDGSNVDYEWVVCDYGCSQRTSDWLREEFHGHVNDGRIKIVKTDHKFYTMGHSSNCAIKRTTGEIVMNVDSDNLLNRAYLANILSIFDREDNVFIGNHSGKLAMRRSDFDRLGGYFEDMLRYGYDEIDLYARAEMAGLKKVVTKLPIPRLQQSNHTRMRNYPSFCREITDFKYQTNRGIVAFHQRHAITNPNLYWGIEWGDPSRDPYVSANPFALRDEASMDRYKVINTVCVTVGTWSSENLTLVFEESQLVLCPTSGTFGVWFILNTGDIGYIFSDGKRGVFNLKDAKTVFDGREHLLKKRRRFSIFSKWSEQFGATGRVFLQRAKEWFMPKALLPFLLLSLRTGADLINGS